MLEYLWNKIQQEYKGDHANAFRLGASKETMGYIVNRDVTFAYTEKEVRRELDRAVEEGVMVKVVRYRLQGSTRKQIIQHKATFMPEWYPLILGGLELWYE